MWYVVLFKGMYTAQNFRPYDRNVVKLVSGPYFGMDIAEHVAEELQKAYDLHCERMREAEFTPIIRS